MRDLSNTLSASGMSLSTNAAQTAFDLMMVRWSSTILVENLSCIKKRASLASGVCCMAQKLHSEIRGESDGLSLSARVGRVAFSPLPAQKKAQVDNNADSEWPCQSWFVGKQRVGSFCV